MYWGAETKEEAIQYAHDRLLLRTRAKEVSVIAGKVKDAEYFWLQVLDGKKTDYTLFNLEQHFQK